MPNYVDALLLPLILSIIYVECEVKIVLIILIIGKAVASYAEGCGFDSRQRLHQFTLCNTAIPEQYCAMAIRGYFSVRGDG